MTLGRSLVALAGVLLQTTVARADAVGVNTHVPAPALIDLVATAGMRWIRVDDNWLSHPDPCSASMGYLAELDLAVTRAATDGLCVFVTLAYTPACASLGSSDAEPQNDVPEAGQSGAYVRRAVRHYRALGVRHFGLWNEPNLDRFFEGTAQDYVDTVLVPGIPAVRQGCADGGADDCRVLGPEMASVGEWDDFMDAVLEQMSNAGLRFDILTHHIYQDFDVPIWEGDSFINVLEDQRFSFTRRSLIDVLEENGLAPDRVPALELWITETGYRRDPVDDADEAAAQAEYLGRVIEAMRARAWWSTVFFYEMLDPGNEHGGCGPRRDPSLFRSRARLLAPRQRRRCRRPRRLPRVGERHRPGQDPGPVRRAGARGRRTAAGQRPPRRWRPARRRRPSRWRRQSPRR
jgi:hypothetical protein